MQKDTNTTSIASNVILAILGAFIARVVYNTLLKDKKANDKEVYIALLASLVVNFFIPKNLQKLRPITESLFATFLFDWIAANLRQNSTPTGANSMATLIQPAFLNVTENLYVSDLYVNADLYVQENLEMLTSLEAETEREFSQAEKTMQVNSKNLMIL